MGLDEEGKKGEMEDCFLFEFSVKQVIKEGKKGGRWQCNLVVMQ